MKKFVLAAVAALSLGIGSAYAARTVPPHNGLIAFGPSASTPSYGAGATN